VGPGFRRDTGEVLASPPLSGKFGRSFRDRQPDPDDLVRVKKWFERLSEHVRAVDFAGAHPLFADDMIAFGTFENFITGREAAERAQWRNVCR